MRTSSILTAAALLGIAALSANAQMGMSASGNDKGATINLSPGPMPVRLQQVTGAPYSARPVNESVTTLANGTHLTRQAPSDSVVYRDSQGRVRTERPMFPNAPTAPVTLIYIDDPVAGYRYLLDRDNQVAHRMAAASTGASPAAPPNQITQPQTHAVPNGISISAEPLGPSTMLGIPVVGVKNTTTFPVGSSMGNDQPVTQSSETWYSTQLGIMVYSKSISPTAVTTSTLKDLSFMEPDPALFTVPAGYKIVDETGPFTIKVTR